MKGGEGKFLQIRETKLPKEKEKEKKHTKETKEISTQLLYHTMWMLPYIPIPIPPMC